MQGALGGAVAGMRRVRGEGVGGMDAHLGRG